MRIFHCITTLGRGGAEMQLLMMLRHQIDKENHEVTVGFLKEPSDLAPSFERLGAKLVPLGSRTGLSAATIVRLADSLRRGSYDVVHTHLLKANFVGGMAARLAGVPRVVAHKHVDAHQMRNKFFALIHDVASRVTDDATIYLSQDTADFYASHAILEPRNRHAVHYAFDPEIYACDGADLRCQLGLGEDAFLFVSLSRIVAQKGVDVLMEAFETVADAAPEAHLAIAGAATDEAAYADRIRQMASGSRFRGRIHLLGLRSDPDAVYRAGDAFVLASRWEGLGLVLLEAMWFGLPIIATRASAIPEIVRDGIDGVLVEPGNSHQLAEAMLAAVRNGRQAHRPKIDRLRAFSPAELYPRFGRIYRNPASGQ